MVSIARKANVSTVALSPVKKAMLGSKQALSIIMANTPDAALTMRRDNNMTHLLIM
jgi:hypothetical protein